jgi:CRISPR-associated protein Cas1
MIKRTLYFGNPSYLSLSNQQLLVKQPVSKIEDAETKPEIKASIPIEDVGIVILDHQQITISQGAIDFLLQNNVALITCNQSHHPTGLMLNLDGHVLQNMRFREQLEASEPLKKQLWAQTIVQKIKNQKSILDYAEKSSGYLEPLIKSVKSGDSENCEATAAAYYWQTLFNHIPGFRRDRAGIVPNNYLNYGYAVLRAIMARSIVGAGLLPTLGIFHANKYNAYCLADDLMEPYRPYVDKMVYDKMLNEEGNEDLTREDKAYLLKIPVIDVSINGETSPLMIATQRTAQSLMKCFCGENRKLLYPELKI